MPHYVAYDVAITGAPDAAVPEHVYDAEGPEVPADALNVPVVALCGAQAFIHVNDRTGRRVELAPHWEADASFCEACERALERR